MTPSPYNPRQISEDALARLAALLDAHGWVVPIIARREDGLVIGDHQRLAANQIRQTPDSQVPVVFLGGLTDTQAKALNIALNNQAAAGEFDIPKLADVLQAIDTGELDVPAVTGFSEAELAEMMHGLDEFGGGDDVPEVAADAISQAGDLWAMGEHRLLCGDSTDSGDVALVLAGNVPFMMVTDPPYGVEYDPQWRQDAAEAGHLAYSAARFGKVACDARADWSDAWALFPGDVVYVWHAGRYAVPAVLSLESCGFDVRAQLIWRKPNFVISRGHYHYQHEPCWYAVRKGHVAQWCGDRSQSTIWDINPQGRDRGDLGHGTQKPVECMARPIRNHGKPGDGVYEPFCGSGTTIIACEELGRECYAIEIEPRYVDVAVKRWQKFTEQDAILEGDGRTFTEITASRSGQLV